MTIKNRLILVFAALLLLAVGIGAIGLYGLQRSNAALKSVYENRTKALDNVGLVAQQMQRIHLSITSSLLDPTDAVMQAEAASIASNLKDSAALLAAYRATSLTAEEARHATLLAEARERLVKEGIAPAVKALADLNLDGTSQLLKEKIVPLLKPVNQELVALRKLQVEGARNEYEVSVQRYRAIQLGMLITILVAATAAAAAAAAVIGSLYRELGGEPSYSGEVVRRIAAGDLTEAIRLRSNDAASLLFAMHAMQVKLAATVGRIRSTTEQVAAGSNDIANGNLDISNRTEQQTSSLANTVAALQKLTETVRVNVDGARQVGAVTADAQAVAVQGGDVVRRVEATMNAINASARQIAEITSVIDGIAFQTNILALNAAVEAARAGEQGRGFAVVAAEVRNLAQRSAAAAREIKGLIDTSSQNASNGSALVAEAASTMQNIQSSVQRVGLLMADITAASEQQAAGIDEVNQAIAEVDAMTQENAALVMDVSTAATSLAQEAAVLTQEVAFFTIGQGAATTSQAVERAAHARGVPALALPGA
jgi:methyl-accepting chemotaxis protein